MNSQTPNGRGAWIFLIAAVIILIIAAVFYWLNKPPKFVVQADQGFKKAKQTIDPERLRNWASGEIIRHQQKNGDIAEIPISEIPDYIQTLYPQSPEGAFVEKGRNNRPNVAIMWGGGFFHWGLYVGVTNDTMPFISENTEYPYNFEWVPGIYYTREAKLKLQ